MAKTNKNTAKTRKTVQKKRATKRKLPTRKTLPVQFRPTQIERDYARELSRIADRTRIALKPLMGELPDIMRSARKEVRRIDGPLRMDAGESKRLRDLVAQAFAKAKLTDGRLAKIARKFSKGVKKHQRKQMKRQIQGALGVDLAVVDGAAMTAATDAFIAENVGYMADLPRKTFAEIEGIVTRGASTGRLHTDVAKEINQRLGVQKKRAKLIARDQIGKFYGKVTSTRHQSLGITQFIWHTVGDERVRPEHASINGVKFNYPGGAPGEGLPGQPILCRCFPDPIFDSLLG